MAYINKFDTSCWEEASKLSCEHMNRLAINEMKYNRSIIDIYTSPPDLDRFCEYPNKDLEHNVIKGFSINKKSCINKQPDYNSGSWDKQFGIYNPFTNTFGCSLKEVFDENSRARMNDKKPCIDKINLSNDKKKLTTIFKEDFEYIDQSKELGTIEDRYNNHNPIVGEEFVQPHTINHPNPIPIKNPNYVRKYIEYPIRNPPQTSDCSTLFNYDRYNLNKHEKLYFEPCS